MSLKSTDTTSDSYYTTIQTSIGELCFFDLIVKNMLEIEKKLPKAMEDLSPKELFMFYLPFFAYIKSDLIDTDLKRTKQYLLKNEDIQKLSDNELEKLAKIFMENNSYLYELSDLQTRHKEDGTLVLNIDKQIYKSLLKQDDEGYLDWFYRTSLKKYEKDKEKWQKLTSSFSSGVSKDMLKTVGLGNSLASSLEWMKKTSFSQPRIPEYKLEMPQIDFAEIERNNEQKRLAPFKELSSKMDMMIEAEQQTVAFMNQANLTQMEISSELKTSSDATNKTSKFNIILTLVVIFLTIVSTGIAAYTVWFNQDSKRLLQTNRNIEYSTTELSHQVERLTNTLVEQNNIQNRKIDLLERKILLLQSNSVVKKGSSDDR